MCSEPLVDPEASAVIFAPQSFWGRFSWPTALLAVGWLILFAVLLTYSPGLAIVQVIVTTPPLVRTLMMARKRATLGRETSLSQTLGMSAMSLGATLMIGFLGLISAVGTFFTVCLGMLAVGSATGLLNQPGTSIWPIVTLAISGLAAVLSVGVVVRAFRGQLRRRWNRDLEQE